MARKNRTPEENARREKSENCCRSLTATHCFSYDHLCDSMRRTKCAIPPILTRERYRDRNGITVTCRGVDLALVRLHDRPRDRQSDAASAAADLFRASLARHFGFTQVFR